MKRIEKVASGARPSRLGTLIGLILALAFSPAQAQEIGFASMDAGLPVVLEGGQRLSALTPFSMSTQELPFSRINVGGNGFEFRRAILGWDSQGRPRIFNQSRRGALLGTFVPGLGTMHSGRRLHGLTELCAVGYLVVGNIRSITTTDDAAEEYNSLKSVYNSEQELETLLQLRTELNMAYQRWQKRYDHHRIQLGLSAAIVGMMVAESWWFNRPLLARGQGTKLVLDVPRLSRSKAVLASFFLPGMGQAYRGQKRSALYLALETVLIQETLDNYTRSEMRQSDYLLMKAHLIQDGLDAAEERELDRLWEKYNQATKDLHIMAGLAGGVWLVNLVDVLVSRPGPTRIGSARPAGGLSLAASPTGRLGLAWTLKY